MTIPNKTIKMLGIEDGTEAHVIRSVAENLGLFVNLYHIGMPSDLVTLLRSPERPDLLLLACHGKDGNIVMPELADFLYKDQPFRGDLTPEFIGRELVLTGQRVLCTGCSTGNENLAEAFLAAGCEWYVAPIGDPHGNASLVFTINFLYNHMCLGLSPEDAVMRSAKEDDDSLFFRLWRGREDTLGAAEGCRST